MVKNYANKLKRERDDALSTAWLTAYFHRVKKMPELKKFLLDGNKPKKKEPQSPNNMLNMIKALNSKFGGDTY